MSKDPKTLWQTLTTPPPPKPAPKLPPFGSEHLVGAGALAAGLFGITWLFIRAARKQSAEVLRQAQQGVSPPMQAQQASLSQDQAMAQTGPSRGQYGYRP
jgi:hypothetical protein